MIRVPSVAGAARSATTSTCDWLRGDARSPRASIITRCGGFALSSTSATRMGSMAASRAFTWSRMGSPASRCATRSAAAAASMPRRVWNTAGGAVSTETLGERLYTEKMSRSPGTPSLP